MNAITIRNEAWIDIMSGQTRGKIVLEISGSGD
jgi:hypothetical protein